MVLKETQAISGGNHDGIFDGSFVMHSANLDLSNILIRNPTFEAPHEQYTEDVMQRITSGLLIEGDLSCNSNLFIEKDVNIRGQLTVEQYQSENIITTTTNNYTFLTVAEDMSLNGRLFVRDDVSLNGSVYIDNSLGIATHSPIVAFDVSTVDAIKLPRGSIADRPITSSHLERGYIRYNTDTSQFEGYGPGNSWVSLGGAVDVDQDTFISAERGAGSDNDQLHFFTASGDTINVPHLRAVIDGSGLTIGSQLCEDVSNNTLISTDLGFPGPRPPQDGLWVQGDASFNTLLRAQDMSVNMLQVKDASINNLGVTDLSVNDLSTNSFTVTNDASISFLKVGLIQPTLGSIFNFGGATIDWNSISNRPTSESNVESVPVGGVIMWSDPQNIPTGFYICDGGQYTEYVNPTDGGTTPVTSFTGPFGNSIAIPDLRGKFVVGYHPDNTLFNTVGNTGGSAQIEATQLPSHQHGGTTDSRSFDAGAIAGTISSQDTSHTHSFSGTTATALHSGSNGIYPNDSTRAIYYATTVQGHNTSNEGGHTHNTTVDIFNMDDVTHGQVYYPAGGENHYNGHDNISTRTWTSSNAGSHSHSIPAHNHTVTITDHNHTYSGTTGDQSASHSHTFTSTANTGSHTHTFTTDSEFGNGQFIGNVQQKDDYYPPYYTMIYLIRYTVPLTSDVQLYGKNVYYVPNKLAIGPSSDASFDIDMRDASMGILFPKGTTAERPPLTEFNLNSDNIQLQKNPAVGLMRYNTDIHKFEGYSGSFNNEKWGSIGGGVMDQDEDTFIRANGANDEDNDQLHFFTASGDTINVPHLRAVMDGSGFTIGSQLSIDVSNSRVFEIENGLNPGEGPLPPENGLWVQGDVSFNSKASIADSVIIGGEITHDANYKLYVNGNMQATSYNALSDERLKEQIYTLSGALETINQLRGVSYYWKKEHKTKDLSRNTYGFIAQEVEQILPNIITTCSGESYNGIYEQKGLNYNSIIPWLVEAVKDLTKENTELKQKVSSLEESMIQITTHLNL